LQIILNNFSGVKYNSVFVELTGEFCIYKICYASRKRRIWPNIQYSVASRNNNQSLLRESRSLQGPIGGSCSIFCLSLYFVNIFLSFRAFYVASFPTGKLLSFAKAYLESLWEMITYDFSYLEKIISLRSDSSCLSQIIKIVKLWNSLCYVFYL
jgi:hypothetical protein